MCVCVCVHHPHICTPAYIHTYIYYVCMYMCVYLCVYTYTNIYL